MPVEIIEALQNLHCNIDKSETNNQIANLQIEINHTYVYAGVSERKKRKISSH